MIYTGAVVAIEIVFLIVWQSVSTLEPGISSSSSSSSTFVRVCKCDNLWVWTGIQIAYFGALVLVGCVLAVLTRRVHTKIHWSEPRWIAYAMYYTLFLGVVFVLVRALVRTSPKLQLVLTSLIICLLSLGTLILIYGVKLYVIIFNAKANQSMSSGGNTASSEFSTEFKPDNLDL